MRPGLAGDTSQRPQTSASPALSVPARRHSHWHPSRWHRLAEVCAPCVVTGLCAVVLAPDNVVGGVDYPVAVEIARKARHGGEHYFACSIELGEIPCVGTGNGERAGGRHARPIEEVDRAADLAWRHLRRPQRSSPACRHARRECSARMKSTNPRDRHRTQAAACQCRPPRDADPQRSVAALPAAAAAFPS